MKNKFFGYGIDLSNVVFKNLEAFVRKYTPDVWETMVEDLVANECQRTDANILEWIENYENDGYYGLSAYLSDVIQEHEDINLSIYDSVSNGYLYVLPNYPWQFNKTMRELTVELLDSILKKYLLQITDDDIIVGYLVMYYDDIDD